jgi:hypothetical protein
VPILWLVHCITVMKKQFQEAWYCIAIWYVSRFAGNERTTFFLFPFETARLERLINGVLFF